MAGAVIGFLHPVVYRGGYLSGDVLIQGASAINIHHLDAPADPQNGNPFFHNQIQQSVFSLIPFRGYHHCVIEQRFTKAYGIKIVASGEKQSVKLIRQILQFRLFCQNRNQKWNTSEMPDGMEIAFIEKVLRILGFCFE